MSAAARTVPKRALTPAQLFQRAARRSARSWATTARLFAALTAMTLLFAGASWAGAGGAVIPIVAAVLLAAALCLAVVVLALVKVFAYTRLARRSQAAEADEVFRAAADEAIALVAPTWPVADAQRETPPVARDPHDGAVVIEVEQRATRQTIGAEIAASGVAVREPATAGAPTKG